MLLLFLVVSSLVCGVDGYVPSLASRRRTVGLSMVAEDFAQDLGDYGDDASSFVLSDLGWRVEKLRLEEANTKRFLKAKPRHLPYDECRKWVQAMNRWDNEEEWKSWIDMGEKRNAYIPARPDEYYGRLGKWISWEHFLGKSVEEEK